MAVKDILVICDAGEANDYRIETSLLIAKVFQSHITAIHLTPYPAVSDSSSGFSKTVDYLASDQKDLAKATAETIKSKFEAKASELKIPYEWMCMDGVNVEFIIDNARYADIVVLPQGYSRLGEESTQRIDDYLSIYIGRPIIVLPDIKRIFNLPKRIIIAWDESQEATRAVHDALPLLKYAEDIQIISIIKMTEEEKIHAINSDALRRHLSHHGVNTEAIYIDQSEKGIGNTILQSAIEYDADLIVMGAYGDTRLKEIVLGGATRHLLNKTTIPLFLSH